MNPTPFNLAAKLSHLSFPNDYNFAELAYDMASIAYDVRLLVWESDRDNNTIIEITELLTIGYDRIAYIKGGYDWVKDKVYIESIKENLSYLQSLKRLLDSNIYLEEVFNELREEFNL